MEKSGPDEAHCFVEGYSVAEFCMPLKCITRSGMWEEFKISERRLVLSMRVDTWCIQHANVPACHVQQASAGVGSEYGITPRAVPPE